jgi:hypothetical protein
MMQLKVEHSEKVAGEASELSAELGWPEPDRFIAGVLGLFHDIGRFSQFAEFGTYSDRDSVDHGDRGGRVVEENNMLRSLSANERAVILDGICHHNGRTIPRGLSIRSLLFVSLIRDCDKLDIYRVVLESVNRDGFQDLTTILPGVSLDRLVSDAMIEEFKSGKSCSIADVKTLGDFLLMQLSWIYEMSYAPALKKIADKRILQDLLGHIEIPPGEEIEKRAMQYIARKLERE